MGNTQTGGTGNGPKGWNEQHGPRGAGSVEYTALEEFLQNVRSDRVRSEFYKIPEAQYTDVNEIRIWASTFNLNGRKPPSDLDLGGYLEHWQSSWPKRDKEISGEPDKRADVFVMGFQESVPLNAQNIIAGWTAVPAGWDRAIDRVLNPWKTEEEIVHAPETHAGSDPSVIDYYVSGWSGVPSANLEARVKNTLSEGTKQESLRKRAVSLDETKLSDKVKATALKPKTEELPDLISLDDSDVPSSKPSEQASPFQKSDAAQSAPKLSRTSRMEKKRDGEFLQLFRHQLVGLYVTGWVRKSLLKRISGVQVTTVATGALGYLANKGAISVRLRIDDSSFVFVTSHLASGSGEGDQIRRNLDFSEIVRRTQFPYEVDLVQVTREDGTVVEDFSVRPDGIPDNASYDVKKAFVGGKWGTVRNLRDLDNIIWVGDLNYRIKAKAQDVIKLIRCDKLNLLLDYEQLSVERAAGKVFQNFIEAPIDFPPTYKYIRGTSYYTGEIEEESSSDSEQTEADLKAQSGEFLTKNVVSYPVTDDMIALQNASLSEDSIQSRDAGFHPGLILPRESERSESSATEDAMRSFPSVGDVPVVHKKEDKPKKRKKKVRTPAWTDRILWYSSSKQLHQLLYGSFQNISVSDHKPVVATFLMEARKFDLNKVEIALQDVRRSIDVEEMASIPRCKLFPTVIDVGNVRYAKPVEHLVTVHNIGEVPAVYSFIPANPGRHFIRSPFPSWLSARPTSGVIKPGKKEQLHLTVSIEGGQWGSADELFGDPENKLDHILVLHIEGGSDFFVSILGSYTLSCFGLSLKNLARQKIENEESSISTRSKEVKLPSMRHRVRGTSVVGLEAPVSEEASWNLDDLSFTQSAPIEELQLKRSTSLAATGHQPNLREGPTGGMVPSQVSRMLYFLAEDDRLRTPHLFVESFKLISKAKENKSELPTVAKTRDVLDQATSFPNGTSAHDVASALFMFFLDLPSPMIPESLARSCESLDISPMLVVSFVKEAMSAIEWSVFDSTMEVMRSALVDENVKKNQLTEESLAGILSQVFFQDIDTTPIRAKSSLIHKEPQEESTMKALIRNRRCAFIQQFLKIDKPLIDLDEVTPSEVSVKFN